MSHVAKTGLVLANVKDYGALGDGVTDDTAAIQLAIDDNLNIGGVFFPEGTYIVARTGVGLSGRNNITIKGTGAKSILQFAAADHGLAASNIFDFGVGASGVDIADLVFDGNRANITNPGTSILMDIAGDGIRLTRVNFTGAIEKSIEVNNARELMIRDCIVNDSGTVGIDLGSSSVCEVTGCYFTTEIAGPAIRIDNSMNQLVISNNIIEFGNTVAMDSISGGSTDVVIANNVILGSVSLIDLSQAVITGNRIDGGNGVAAALHLSSCDDTSVNANSVSSVAASPGIRVTDSNNTAIRSNHVEAPNTANHHGILIDDSNTRIVVAQNIVGGGDDAIRVAVSNAEVAEDISIEGNVCNNGDITFADDTTGGTIRRVSVKGNSIDDNNIRFLAGPTYTGKPIIYGNRAITSPWNTADLANLTEPAVIAGGVGGDAVGGDNTGTQLVGTGDPEGNITGWVGDTFQRVDGGADTTLYRKETGNNTNTGWVAVAAGGGAFTPIFGSGEDGNTTLAINTTLTADLHAEDLTVNGGVTVDLDGFRIYVRGTLTNNGVIQDRGVDAGGAGAGGSLNNTSAPIQGGITASAERGKAGGDGETANGSGGGTMSNISAVGGAGGDGGDGDGGGAAGGSGGAVSSATAEYTSLSPTTLLTGLVTTGNMTETSSIVGGAGGGGGGGDNGANPGGGGGGGGGVAIVVANEIAAAGTINADGGDGAAGTAADTGGGGGGGGGFVALVARTITGVTTGITANGGAAGASGGGNGAAGSAGSAGVVVINRGDA